MSLVPPAWLDRVRGGFDSVRLLDYDALCDLSITFAPGTDPNGHWLFFRKRERDLSEGYVILPIPDPAVLADEAVRKHVLSVAHDAYAERRAAKRLRRTRGPHEAAEGER